MHNLRFELDPPLDGELREKLIHVWVDVSNAGGAVGFVPPTTVDRVRPVAEEAFRRSKDGRDHIVVAFDPDEPVAFLFLVGRPGELFSHWATLKRLQVQPELQGQGIGGALLEATHEMARHDLGLEQLLLTVRGGTDTEVFYERHGYKEVARIPGLIRVAQGDDREEIYMTRPL
ncbi:MAG: GNAT family N-acetyltransferase [Actinobacteria bacterium]|nr:GNAT family N-acetyltransferase [Actinomycetota bacterium]